LVETLTKGIFKLTEKENGEKSKKIVRVHEKLGAKRRPKKKKGKKGVSISALFGNEGEREKVGEERKFKRQNANKRRRKKKSIIPS